jgi:filamentous hemagglutinin family protein
MRRVLLLAGLVMGAIGWAGLAPGLAQVTPDGTLNTSISGGGSTFTITNGTARGSNLFHSFQQFGIPTNGSATFDLVNTPNISTIFSRVTGGSVSTIDGVIQTVNSPNPISLFLINPAGILFGPNASLNIGGSFVGTTASSVRFADGTEFSAANPAGSALLTVSVPIGLQMGQSPGAIVINGAQLEVASGNTLALVGGDIIQTGGRLSVPGGNGRIELVALGDNSQAGLQPALGGWAVDPLNSSPLRDLQFTQNALVQSDGIGSASITAVGRNFLLSNDSKFQGYNRGDLAGGAVTIRASESILVQETSDVRSDVDGSGNGGSVSLFAPKIDLYNEGAVVSVAWGGTGHAGNLLVEGREVTVNSDPIYLANDTSTRGSAIVTVAFGQGNAGNIAILADTLTYLNGAGLVNFTFGQGNSGTTTLVSRTMTVRNSTGGGSITTGPGNGGDLNIITDTFYMDGSSGYTTSSFDPNGGRAGNINITARSIISRDDGGFNSDTFGNGKAGNITFKADYIELDESQLNSRTSGSGNAGVIDITAQTLRILNGGQLNVTTKGTGNGGNIRVNANTLELNGEPTHGILPTQNTGIISSVLPDSMNPTALTGRGGNISVNASNLLIRDGALISASTSAGQGNGGNIDLQVDRLDMLSGGQVMAITRSQGNAGTITVNARDQIRLSGQDALHTERVSAYIPEQDYSDVEYNIGPSSGIFGNATSTSTGNGGGIQLTTRSLQVQSGATVSVGSQGTGNAGNLNINANTVNLDQQGSLQANTQEGQGGRIQLTANQLQLTNNSLIDSSTTSRGNAGEITLNTTGISLNNSTISSQSSGAGNSGTIKVFTNALQLNDAASLSTAASAQGRAGNLNVQAETTNVLNGSQITTRSIGTGDGGTINLNGSTLTLRNGSSVNASTASGNGGNLNFNLSGLLYLRDLSQLAAEAGGTGNGGNINLNALFVVGGGNSDIIANAVRGNGGNIQIATQGIFGLKFRPLLTAENDITASSQFGVNGTVQIQVLSIDPSNGLADLPVNLSDPSRQIAAGCAANTDSSFVVTGRGGTPDSPTQLLRSDRPWADTRDLSQLRSSRPAVLIALTPVPSPIVEASSLVHINGQLELIAINSPMPLLQRATCAGSIDAGR